MPMIVRIAMLVMVALIAASCASTDTLTSIKGGEAKVFERPPYVVLGKTQYDQDWVDSQVEGGVAAFGWARPAPRPPDLDRAGPARIGPPVAKKKPSFLKRVKQRFTGMKQEPAVPYVSAPIVPAVVETKSIAQPPAPKQRDPVDELLQPSETVPAIRRIR